MLGGVSSRCADDARRPPGPDVVQLDAPQPGLQAVDEVAEACRGLLPADAASKAANRCSQSMPLISRGRGNSRQPGDRAPGLLRGARRVVFLEPGRDVGWCLASTSGLTRRLIGALRPWLPATSLSRSSSAADSTLKQRMPASSACRISSTALARTAEKTIFAGRRRP